jgi:hypothetical protein
MQINNLLRGLLMLVCVAGIVGPLAPAGSHTPVVFADGDKQVNPGNFPDSMTVTMYVVNSLGAIENPPRFCTASLQARRSLGCTYVPNHASFEYPYATGTPQVDLQNDYLLDVVGQELSPEAYPVAAATRAVAIGARSFAWYYNGAGNVPPGQVFNNSTQFQIFYPYRFERLGGGATPNNASHSPRRMGRGGEDEA